MLRIKVTELTVKGNHRLFEEEFRVVVDGAAETSTRVRAKQSTQLKAE
jgi:hypothetical protein